MQIDNQLIMDTIKGLAERPEWCERSMDPERAKVDLVLLAARGDGVTVAGMARRWGMPRTSARRVIQTATALVPWLDTYLDSPKNDKATGHDSDHLDTMVDMDLDSNPDSQKQGTAMAPTMPVDTMADMDLDSPADCHQNLQSADHKAEELDTMTEPEPSAAIPGGAALFDDVQENESMDTIVDIDTDSQHQAAAMAPAVPVDTMADMDVDSPFCTFLDLSDSGVDKHSHAEIDQIGPELHAVAAVAPAPTLGDEARVEARAREMAQEDWDVADARTFETCEGDFDQFWTYRKRHFLAQARQVLGLAEF